MPPPEVTTNGPLNSQEYRSRNPQTPPRVRPTRELSLRTRREIYAGRLQVKLSAVRDGRGPCSKAPIPEQLAYERWLRDFLEVCYRG